MGEYAQQPFVVGLKPALEKFLELCGHVRYHNKTLMLLDNPESKTALEKVEDALISRGYVCFAPHGHGKYAIVFLGSDSDIIRIVDERKESRRQDISEVVQPSFSQQFASDIGGHTIRVEVLPKLTTYKILVEAVGEDSARLAFKRGRLELTKSLREKGYYFNFAADDDTFDNIAIDEDGNFKIVDADCIKQLEQNRDGAFIGRYQASLEEDYQSSKETRGRRYY